MYALWAARSGCGVLRKQVFESNRSVPLVPSESGDPETEIALVLNRRTSSYEFCIAFQEDAKRRPGVSLSSSFPTCSF